MKRDHPSHSLACGRLPPKAAVPATMTDQLLMPQLISTDHPTYWSSAYLLIAYGRMPPKAAVPATKTTKAAFIKGESSEARDLRLAAEAQAKVKAVSHTPHETLKQQAVCISRESRSMCLIGRGVGRCALEGE